MQCQADVLSLDWTVNLGKIRGQVNGKMALQGNLDPTALYASPNTIRQLVKDMLYQYGSGEGHIANLGHGILPDIPVDHAKAFVESVKEESQAYH